MNGVYFVAETVYKFVDIRTNISNAGKAIRIEAKNLAGAKTKATKLWVGNPDAAFCTLLILGDHIDEFGRIDHALSTKNGEFFSTKPCWVDADIIIIRSYNELRKLLAVDAPASKILDQISRNGLAGELVDEINELLDSGQLSDTTSIIRFVNEKLKYLWGDELVYEDRE